MGADEGISIALDGVFQAVTVPVDVEGSTAVTNNGPLPCNIVQSHLPFTCIFKMCVLSMGHLDIDFFEISLY